MGRNNPFQLPFVSYQDKQYLPDTPGIYYLLNLQLNQIIYIGRSRNIRQRWTAHHRSCDAESLISVYRDGIVIAWELYPYEELERVEKEAIKLNTPLLNYKGMDDSFDILYEAWWEDSLVYNQYLVEAFSNPDLSRYFLENKISQQHWRDHQVAKTNLIGILNYPHPITGQSVPVYRYLESDLITYVNHAEELNYFAHGIHGVGNQDIKKVMRFFSLEKSKRTADKLPFVFQDQLNEDELALGLATLLADLSLADVKAHNEMFPEADFWGSVFSALEEPDAKMLMLDLTDPSTHGYIEEQWERLLDLAWEDLEGQSQKDVEI